VQRLSSEKLPHAGDALQEIWAWSDGTAFLVTAVRLVDHPGTGDVASAEVRLELNSDWVLSVEEDAAIAREKTGAAVGVTCLGMDGAWACPEGKTNPWAPINGQPPYYKRWGPYYDQWGGTSGWSRVDSDVGALRFIWSESGEPLERSFAGTIALTADSTGIDIAQRLADLRECPPLQAEGSCVLFHSRVDGATYVRASNGSRIRNNGNTSARIVVLGKRPVQVPGEALAFPVTDGGVTDDPNGPDLLRPDDPHGPILTDAQIPADEQVLLMAPGSDAAMDGLEGLRLSGRRWDERQELILKSSSDPRHPLLQFSTRDLKARELRFPGAQIRTMAHLPLYWFRMNAPSAHHCLNVPESIRLVENGPERVALAVRASNPGRTAVGEVEASIPFQVDRLTIQMRCRLNVLADAQWPDIQYCNFFPETTRLPELWNTDRVLVISEDGQWMRLDPRHRIEEQVVAGKRFEHYEGRLVVALYGGAGGTILARSSVVEGGGMMAGYKLCGCWLDNHLFLRPPGGGPIPGGTEAEVALDIEMLDLRVSDSAMLEIGEGWIKNDTLTV
jgi:hypothetical protein